MLHRVLVQRYCIALAFLIGIRVVTLEFDDAEAFKPKTYLYDLDVI